MRCIKLSKSQRLVLNQMERSLFERELNEVLNQAYGYSLRLANGDADEASDLLQEASLAAFKGKDTFAVGTNFKAWFFKILTNQFYRRGGRGQIQTVNIDDTPEPYMFIQAWKNGVAMDSDPEQLVFSKVTTEEVLRALDALPEEYKIASSLFFVNEMSYEEIAEALDVPIGTIRSRLHRGRKLLQVKLWDLAMEQGLVGGEPVV